MAITMEKVLPINWLNILELKTMPTTSLTLFWAESVKKIPFLFIIKLSPNTVIVTAKRDNTKELSTWKIENNTELVE